MTSAPGAILQRRFPWLAVFFLTLPGCPSLAADNVTAITMNPAAQQNAGLTTTVVRQGVFVQRLDAMGTVTAEGSRIVHIHPAGSGKVLTVAVVPGQHVHKGDVLLTYQDHSLHLVRLQMIRMRANLATAQASYQNALATYNRGRELEGATVAAGETKRRFAALKAARDDVTAAAQCGHVGLRPGFINENQTHRINPSLILPPLPASARDVGPILFAGVQCFF